MTLAFLNGQMVPAEQLVLSFHDAGFVYGATITDFCRTYQHQLFRWAEHLQRFRSDCEAIHINIPYSDEELKEAATAILAADFAQSPAERAIITFATPGQLGWMVGADNAMSATVGMHSVPILAEKYSRFFTEGVTLEYAGWVPQAAWQMVNPGIKHRSRLHWWLASQQSQVPGSVPVITDQSGDSPDTAIGGVLSVVNGMVVRPDVGRALEAVSFRVVEELCQKLRIPFHSGTLEWTRTLMEEPSMMTEVMLAGSGFGIAGVKAFVMPQNQRRRDFDWPGPITQQLQQAWSELIGVDITQEMRAV